MNELIEYAPAGLAGQLKQCTKERGDCHAEYGSLFLKTSPPLATNRKWGCNISKTNGAKKSDIGLGRHNGEG